MTTTGGGWPRSHDGVGRAEPTVGPSSPSGVSGLPTKAEVVERLGGPPAPSIDSAEATVWQVGLYEITADHAEGTVTLGWGDDPAAAEWSPEQARSIFLAGLAACDRMAGDHRG